MTRVLLVEDEPLLRDLVRDFLVSFDYEVHAAADGVEALDKLQEAPPDVLVLDLMLPNIDGWSVLAACREQSRAHVPVIVTSTHPRAAQVDAQAVLPKPYDLDSLQVAIEQLVRPG